MRTWTPKIPELSGERVGELQRFCWQYREKKARIAAVRSGAAVGIEGGHGKGGIGRPTERSALYALESKDARDVAMIEETAAEVAAGSRIMKECIIANVCDRVLPEHMNLPMGRRQFYQMRKCFFVALDKKR